MVKKKKKKEHEKGKEFGRNEKQWGCGCWQDVPGFDAGSPGFDPKPKHLTKPGVVVHPIMPPLSHRQQARKF